MLSLLLIGICTGFLSGLLGIGGGIILIPALNDYFQKFLGVSDDLSMHAAIATSFAVIFMTLLITSITFYQNKKFDKHVLMQFIPSLIIGIFIGNLLRSYLSGFYLEKLFALFLLLLAFKTLLFPKPEFHAKKKTIVSKPIAMCIGALSTIFGIGGGLLMIPYFSFLGLALEQAIANSVFSGLAISFLGSLSNMFFVQDPLNLAFSSGYIYWPACALCMSTSMIFSPIGSRLATKIPSIYIKSLLILIILLSAARLLLK